MSNGNRTRSGSGGVVIASCYPRDVSGMFHESMMQLVIHDAHTKGHVIPNGDVLSMKSGPRIASARNKLAEIFLNHSRKPEWMWMVDVDMTYAPDTLERLVQTATDNQLLILGGLCFGGGAGGACFPTMYRLTPPDDDGVVVQTIEDYPENALVKVDATGAACLLIHRAALLKMYDTFGTIDTPKGRVKSPSPWFAETQYAGREFGEDWTFCMRAGQVDIPIYVHTGIKLGHEKSTILDEVGWNEYKAKRELLGGRDAVVNDFRQRAMGTNAVVG